MKKCLILLLGHLSAAAVLLLGSAHANNQQTLSAIHQSINQQEKKLAQQHKTRSVLTQELQRQETAIALLLKTVQEINSQLSRLNSEIAYLNKQINLLKQKRDKQQYILAKQLESAFKLQRHSGLEFVLNGEKSERNERIIVYFGYINRERQAQIQQLKITQRELTETKKSVLDKKSKQQQLQLQLKKKQVRLERNRNERKKTLTAITLSMQEGQQRLTQLYENEAKLQAKLMQATNMSKAISDKENRQAAQIQSRQRIINYKPTFAERALMARVSGIGIPRNRLDWPLFGKIRHYFGESIQGQLYWKGLVIGGQEGNQVRAIADGRVILASWLQGYGFMVAIDHGKGDMSLYGYNQRVLVNVEENIKKGQVIALVGNSGGQGDPGLYFEIRRDGKALNPQVWLKK